MIQVVKIEDAVGQPLAHDITEIRPGEFKGPAFHKGYRLKGRDLDHLRRLGKNHLYVLKCESDETMRPLKLQAHCAAVVSAGRGHHAREGSRFTPPVTGSSKSM
jgi:hypothetical protein